MADISLKGFRTQRPFASGHALFVQASSFLAAGSVFSQKNMGIGAVGANGQGVFRKLDSLLLVGFIESPVHERLGLAERGVLVCLALQTGDKLLHHALHRSAVGEITGRLR
jgi:hypothetical protein